MIGGQVALSEGSFYVASQIALGEKPVHLIGAGQEATALVAISNLNTDMIKVGLDTTPVGTLLGSISNMTLRGNSAGNVSGSGIKQFTGDSFLMFRLMIRDFKDRGVWVGGVDGSHRADYTTILGCRFDLNKKEQILASNPGANSLHIISCRISDGGTAMVEYGAICLDNVADVLIEACHLWQDYGNEISINIGGPHIIVGCGFNSPKMRAIQVSGASSVHIGGCTFQEASMQGVGLYPIIGLKDATHCNIIGNTFGASPGVSTPTAIVHEYNTSDSNIVADNIIHPGFTTMLRLAAAPNSIFRHNTGYVTENSGQVRINNTTTFTKVVHGLSAIPDRVFVSPITNIGLATKYWVSSKDSDADGLKFTLTVDLNPGGNIDFDWRAQVKEG